MGLLLAALLFAQNPLKRFEGSAPPPPPRIPFEGGRLELRPGEVIVLTGSANAVFEQQFGWIETHLTAAAREARPRFRPMGWEGDTVYRQERDINFGDWKAQLEAAGASTVIAWFGQIEALDDTKGPEEFAAAYGALLDQFRAVTPRLVVLGPPLFEKPAGRWTPDLRARNDRVKAHAAAARRLAADRGAIYIDLLDLSGLTENGIHLTPAGDRLVAQRIAPATGDLEPLRREIVAKNAHWFNAWRPGNWCFLYSDRTTQPFGQAGGGNPGLRDELEKMAALLKVADDRIHAVALGQAPPPLVVEPLPPQERLNPADELATLQPRADLEVALWASEADGLIKPLQIRFDERGRLWAACTPTYPHVQSGAVPADFILVCEDSDGDGRADKFTRFAEGLHMPMGFEFGDGGLYVCDFTQIVHLRDTDGDGKADARRVVLSGFGTGDTHQLINSLRWGPDGMLWASQGLHVFSHIETPFGVERLDRAGLWRINPRTLRTHDFFGGAVAGANCWGVVFDDWGQVFHVAVDNVMCFYSLPGMIPVDQPENYYKVGALAVSNTKSMELEIVGTAHLPDDLQGALIKSVYMGNRVEAHRLIDDGSGFRSEPLGPLVSSTSTAFRPVETKVGPDGALYICDWFNPIIGHYQASYRDPRRDRSHGRIWRMKAKDRPLVKAPALAGMTAPQLVGQLASRERWVREQARRLLFGMPEAIAAADARVPSADTAMLFELTGVYAAHESLRPEYVKKLCESPDDRLRAFGTRHAGLDLLRVLATDPSARVRLEAVVAASYQTAPEAVEIAALALDHPRDRFLDYALRACVRALKPRWRPALAAGKLTFGGKAAHLAFVLQADGSKDVAGEVRRALEAGGPREDLLELLAAVGGPEDLQKVLAAPTPRLAEALATAARIRGVKPAGDLEAALAKLPLPLKLKLGGAWKLESVRAAAKEALVDSKEEVWRAAVGALADLGDREALAKSGRPAAVAALAGLDPAAAAPLAAELLALVKDPRELFTGFLLQKGGSAALAAALEAKRPPKAAAEIGLEVMSAIGRSDEKLTALLTAAAGLTRRSWTPSPELVQEARESGNAARGAEVFRRPTLGCVACHAVAGQGGAVGPDLSSLGTAQPPEFILESVLDPNRAVKEGYTAARIETSEGDDVFGIVVRESDEDLVVRDAASKQEVRVPRAQVVSRKPAGSAMPSGLADTLTREELRDLLRYLSELGRIR